MYNPREITQKSIMPAYPQLQVNAIDFGTIQKHVDAMAMIGVPYGDAVNKAEAMARAQARDIAAGIETAGGPKGLEDKEIVALTAYLQRLGRDLKNASATTAVVPPAAPAVAPGAKPIALAAPDGSR
jgi:cytochrome c oxidase cbb3-type subunit I/II